MTTGAGLRTAGKSRPHALHVAVQPPSRGPFITFGTMHNSFRLTQSFAAVVLLYCKSNGANMDPQSPQGPQATIPKTIREHLGLKPVTS